MTVKDKLKVAFISNWKNLRYRRLFIIGIATLLCLFGFSIIRYRHQSAIQREFFATMNTVWSLDQLKLEATSISPSKYTNGYPWTSSEELAYLKLYIPTNLCLPFAFGQRQDCIICSGYENFIYFLNPVGVPARVRFLHDFAGHAAGSEFSATIGGIVNDLNNMTFKKNRLAKWYHWPKGHPVTFDDFYPSDRPNPFCYDYSNAVLFMLNPVGTPVTARVVRPWRDLPAGLEMTLDNVPDHL